MENAEKTEEIKETVDLLLKLMLDPTRVAIWFEICRKPGITAKGLMKVIKIQKTAMYYHLDKLKKNAIIGVKISKGQKHYEVIKNFFELYVTGDEFLKGVKKEFRLFSLLVINSLIQREINRVMNSSEEEIKKRKYPISHVGMWFCSKEKLELVKDDWQKLLAKMKAIDGDEGVETITGTSFTYYWGLVDFE